MYLKQSTAASVALGPFVDDVDGRTPETGLTIIAASVYVSKNGLVFAAKNEATTASHSTLGFYRTFLDTTDTNAAGNLMVYTAPSGALPVWREFTVLSASVYDSFISGASYFPANVQLWNGVAVTTPATAGMPVVTIGASGLAATAVKAGALYAGAFTASALAASTFAACSIDANSFAVVAGSQVWNAAVRLVTGGSVVATTGSVVALTVVDKTGYALAASSIAASTLAACAIDKNSFAVTAGSQVWDAAVRTVTGGSVVATTGSVVALTVIDKTGYVLAASSVAASTLAASAIDSNSFALTAGSQVWDAAVRTVTGGSVVATSGSVVATSNLDKTGYTLAACSITAATLAACSIDANSFAVVAASQVWNAAVRTITGGSVIATSGSVVALTVDDKAGYALAASSIAASTLAACAIDNNSFAVTAGSQVWDAAVKTITGGSVIATSGSVVALTVDDKAGYVLATCSIGASTIAASAINNFSLALTAGSQVWDAAVRTITGGSVVATSGSVVTTNNLDKTGYVLAACSLSSSAIAADTLADVNAQVVDALTVDVIADTTPDHEVRPTIAQAVLLLTRFLLERSVSSTTVTVKKEDGVSAVLTLSLSDADNPVSITRAT